MTLDFCKFKRTVRFFMILFFTKLNTSEWCEIMSKSFNWCKDKTRLATFNTQVVLVDQYGDKYWYLNGLLHREDGPAIEYANGTKAWCLNGLLHRVNGAAVEYANGDKAWWLNGELHREDGPAFEFANGDKEWWLNDKEYSESDYWKEINK